MINIARNLLVSALTVSLSFFAVAQATSSVRISGTNEGTAPTTEPGKVTHSFPLSKSDVKIFDTVILGQTTIDQLNVFSKENFGTVGNVFFSREEVYSIPLLFGVVVLDKNIFDAVFFENILIEMRLQGDVGEGIDKQLAKELRSSFDKKYKRLAKTSRKENTDAFAYTYTTERWSGPQEAFVVELQDKRKFTVNLSRCRAFNNALSQLGGDTARLEYECNKATDNLPILGLAYKFLPGVEAATRAIKRDEEAGEQKRKAEASKKSSKF